ncbi:lyase family protein [Candidatus Haliotispira prima]|uniref:Lyase family protein n=1 Tax=Candidatus Haliotispira prima TaxID=3034016 RepID=A0ABY8MJQ8_9SPIO|nr:lyase family protein [Candidatus Haliotispira prima]
MNVDLFSNLSPIDHRYRNTYPELHENLGRYLDERAAIRYQIQAELALLKAHMLRQGKELSTIEHELAGIEIDPEEVYREEEKTRHNIRALVNVLVEKVPEAYRRYVHLGATSMDIVDTANAMRLRDAMQQVVLPQLGRLQNSLIVLAENEAATPQVGRTHGQFAVPVTFGFAIASYVSRLGQSLEALSRLSADLRGKLAGAVGAYNALSLITDRPREMERQYLDLLGLSAAEYSSQIVMPEYQLRLLLELNTAFGIIANLADDLRHLQRSEIDEVREYFSPTQVGSSTMPQKRNPWNCEHVKSLWKTFSPRIMSFYMDQISEHQRDLSNSASARFVADFVAGFSFAAERMHSIVSKLGVSRKHLQHNLKRLGDLVLAEPLYILLSLGGVRDAHEVVRRLTLQREESGRPLPELLSEEPELQKVVQVQLAKVGYDASFLSSPEQYLGRSEQRTQELCRQYRTRLQQLGLAQ